MLLYLCSALCGPSDPDNFRWVRRLIKENSGDRVGLDIVPLIPKFTPEGQKLSRARPVTFGEVALAGLAGCSTSESYRDLNLNPQQTGNPYWVRRFRGRPITRPSMRWQTQHQRHPAAAILPEMGTTSAGEPFANTS